MIGNYESNAILSFLKKSNGVFTPNLINRHRCRRLLIEDDIYLHTNQLVKSYYQKGIYKELQLFSNIYLYTFAV